MKRLTSIVALSCVFMLACCFVVFGACAVGLTQKLGLSNTEWSLIPAVFLYTACLVQFFIGGVTDKIGHKPVAILGFVVTAASMMLIALAPSLGFLLAAAVCLGLGSMCLNTVGNTIIPQVLFGGSDPARASNFGNGFFGMGLFLAPLIINYAPSYQYGLYLLGGLNLLLLVLALLSAYPQAELGYRFSTAIKVLGQAPVLIAALALLCYVGLENSMSNWTAKLMNELFVAAGSAAEEAGTNSAAVLSAFGLAVMTGRFVASAVKNLTAIGVKVIVVASAVSVVALGVMYTASSPIVAILAVIVTGLAFAPIFPTIVGVTFSKYEPRYYGSIFGIIFAVGLFGGGFLQNLIGYMAGTSVQSAFITLAVAAGALIIIGILMGKAKSTELE